MSLILLAMDAVAPISVSQTGLSWGSIVTSGVFSAGFLSLIGVMWKTRVPMKKLALEGDKELRDDLMQQLAKQEADNTARTVRLETRLDEQRAKYETLIEYERVIHANDLATMRHRMNNLDQCLTMLLALIEENPEKAQAAAKRVREMREKQEEREVAEKAMLAASRVPPRSTP